MGVEKIKNHSQLINWTCSERSESIKQMSGGAQLGFQLNKLTRSRIMWLKPPKYEISISQLLKSNWNR